MVAVVDGALQVFTRRPAPPAQAPPHSGEPQPLAPGFDRATAARAFSLGRELPRHTRAELRASVAALRGRAFAGGYGDGAAIAREAEAQRAEEMRARLEAAHAKVGAVTAHASGVGHGASLQRMTHIGLMRRLPGPLRPHAQILQECARMPLPNGQYCKSGLMPVAQLASPHPS